jgi:hypothetical protein
MKLCHTWKLYCSPLKILGELEDSQNKLSYLFFFGKLTYVLKEEDTNIIRGIPQIYNDNRNIKQQMAIG